EKRLMIAILTDAIDCFLHYGSVHKRRGRVVHEAEQWLLSGDPEWIFSFENICDFLGLNASYLRRGLQEGSFLSSWSPSQFPSGRTALRTGLPEAMAAPIGPLTPETLDDLEPRIPSSPGGAQNCARDSAREHADTAPSAHLDRSNR